MIALEDRRPSHSTRAQVIGLPYHDLRGEEKMQSTAVDNNYRTSPWLHKGAISILSGSNVGYRPEHASLWAFVGDSSCVTAPSFELGEFLGLIEVDHFFPKSIACTTASTSPKEASESSDLLMCLSQVYFLEAAKRHRAASKVIFSFIERRFAKSDLASVNQLLTKVEMGRLSVWSISGLLRVTARAKSRLPIWGARLNDAKKTLAARGEKDLDSLFMGL